MPFGQPNRFDYLQLRLDILSGLINAVASPIHERQFGVSVRQLRVLRFVKAKPGLVQGELAGLTMLEKTSVSKLVTSLARASLLTRRAGRHDGRQVHLHLTRRGEALLAGADRFSKRWQQRFLSVLPEDELRTLLGLLEKLTEHARRTVDSPGAAPAAGHGHPRKARRTQR